MASAFDLRKFLADLGLSDKEVDLYLQTLRSGPQTASTLAKKMGIPRSTVNFLFDQLAQKGFASKEIHESTTYFHVLDPELIENMLIERSATLKKQAHDFKEVLPLLKSLEGRPSLSPKVTYYQGLEALLRTIDDCCRKDESVYFISSHNNMHPAVRDYIEKVYVPKSKQHVNKNQMILSDGSSARDYVAKAKGVYEDVIFVDPAQNPFKITFAVHGNKVDFISYDPADLSGVVIENELVAEHMKTVFNLLKGYFKKA